MNRLQKRKWTVKNEKNNECDTDVPKIPKKLSKKEIRETIDLLPVLNREILEQSENELDREDIGLIYDEDMYQKKCKFILENIPYEEQISSQVAYLIRAFMCSQMFKEGNKRTAIFFADMWLRANEYRLNVSNKELWDFVKRLPERCPRIPISNQEIISKDKLFHNIEKWISKMIVLI